MAVESKRGCGFRKIGGLYLVGGNLSAPCDRLPFPLTVCPCCGEGIKFSRGFTWIQPETLFQGNHKPENKLKNLLGLNSCSCIESFKKGKASMCPCCMPEEVFNEIKTAGLIWIGDKFYSPEKFMDEAAEMGVSRRIKTIPRGFKIGETWLFFAHKKAITKTVQAVESLDSELFETEDIPGIFCAFRPTRIERIVKQSEFDIWEDFNSRAESFGNKKLQKKFLEDAPEAYHKLQKDVSRGITLIPVPDNDPDHQ